MGSGFEEGLLGVGAQQRTCPGGGLLAAFKDPLSKASVALLGLW